MKQKLLTFLLALVGVAAAWAGQPDKCLDECTGGEGLIHVQGWAYDPDASAQSINVHVYVYTDESCTSQYGSVHVLTANVPRPDVNAARGITGNHGFSADIPIADAGNYWVKFFAIDTGGDGNPQIGATTAVTVTATTTPTTSGQTLLNGDLNHNGVIDISDVTGLVNVVLGRSQAEVLNVITSVSHEYVDLGLPSGTLWATCNIGAENPEDYGDYFAWGETEGYNSGKTTFNWSTYKYCNGSSSTLTKYCTDSDYGTVDNLTELELSDDAAYVNWGSGWRMPSKEQFEELINSSYTTTEWTTVNGVYGRKITSKSNGNSIFLSAAGYRNGTSLSNAGSDGYYWSRTINTSYLSSAYNLYFYSSNIYTYGSSRYSGRSVRPVRNAYMVSGITLSQTSLALNSGATGQLTATVSPSNALEKGVTWSSSDESVAYVDQSGLVTAVSGGTCTITCTAKDGSGVSATCTVTVTGGTDSHEYVDLGLPSGTLWATCNIGADNPEDYGDYFAWGETEGYNSGKTTFDWSTYMYCNGSYTTLTKYCNKSSYGYNGFTDTLTELELSDDAAYVNWGADWRMPSDDQFTELINSSYTTTEWTTVNGVYGRKITSKSNGNSLFLPTAGYRNGSSLNYGGSYGFYWSRTLDMSRTSYAYGLYFESSDIGTSIYGRYYGRSVRPVRKQ